MKQWEKVKPGEGGNSTMAVGGASGEEKRRARELHLVGACSAAYGSRELAGVCMESWSMQKEDSRRRRLRNMT